MNYALTFLIGLAIGSFLNVCIYRIPRKLSIVFPSSHCPSCNAPIRFTDNVPLLSYLLLRGRCRACGAAISWRYPIVELATAFLALASYMRFGFSFELFFYFAFSCALVTVTFIDLELRVIPDRITIPFLLIGLVGNVFTGLKVATLGGLPHETWYLGLLWSVFGVVVGGGSLALVGYLYNLATKREGIGGGDVKLMGAVGAFLGWKATVGVIFFASLVGSVIGILLLVLVLRITVRKSMLTPIPFGCFLAPSAILIMFFWSRFVEWYLTNLSAGY